MKKREFIKSASAAAVLASLGFTIESCSESEPGPGTEQFEIDLNDAPYDALQTEEAWLFLRSEKILLVNVGGEINAFSSICTLQNCSTNWKLGENATCTCHNSVFDSSGSPISGPAQKALTQIGVTMVGTKVTIG